MPIKEFYSGKKAKVYQYYQQGKDGCLSDFYTSRKIPKQVMNTLSRLIERFCDYGEIKNEELFKHEEDGIYVFKPKSYRVFCFFLKGQIDKCVVATNYYQKKSGKMPRTELLKAQHIRQEIEG